MAETTTLKVLREAIAGQLGLLINATITVDADPVFTIPSLSDDTPDAERMRDAYLYQSGEYRRILSFAYPTTEQVTVTRVGAITTGACQVYLMLSPTEMNEAINEALKELYYVETETVTLVANTYTYALPTWMQQKGQILSVGWRDISVLTTRPEVTPLSGYTIKEDANALTLFVGEGLRSVTTYDIQVSGRRNYSALATDAATTTCPYPLIFSVAMVKVLHKLLNKYGKGILTLYGPKMQIAEGEMAKNKMDWLPRLSSKEYLETEGWLGPDTNANFDYPTW